MKQHLSRFIRKTLMPDERVLAEARFHVFYVFYAFLSCAFCVAMGAGLQYALGRYMPLHGMGVGPFVSLCGIGLWVLLVMLLKRWTTEIFLTDRRLLYKQGFFLVKVAEADIEQLASDHVEQSLLGRMMDYGALRIRCIEANDFCLPPIARPYEFRNDVERAKQAYRERYMHAEVRYRRHDQR